MNKLYCTNALCDSVYCLCEEVGVVKRVHLLSGEVRRVATALKVVEEVQEEVQEVKDEWDDEEVEGNGGLRRDTLIMR